MVPGAGSVPAIQRIPLPGAEMLEEEPLYVNAKQYHRILKRRQARAKLEAEGKIPKERRVRIKLRSGTESQGIESHLGWKMRIWDLGVPQFYSDFVRELHQSKFFKSVEDNSASFGWLWECLELCECALTVSVVSVGQRMDGEWEFLLGKQ